jgi:hypothetical protein
MKISTGPVPAIGLLLTALVAVYMVLLASAQQPLTGNLTNAATAEVRDAQGQVVLRGPFASAEEDDDDVERRATLAPTGIDADASGEAEVEFDRTRPTSQEVEFTARNLQPDASYTLVIDGQDVAAAKANSNGRVSGEWEVRIP